jgi:hypothetical protein
MYYAVTRFFVNLKDGPVTPLLTWMQKIGPEACCQIRELSVHYQIPKHEHLAYGTDYFSLMSKMPTIDEIVLMCGRRSENTQYKLSAVGQLDVNNLRDSKGKHIMQLLPALRAMGLDLRQVYEVVTRHGRDHFSGYMAWFVVTEAAGRRVC